MSSINITVAKEHLDVWLEAEKTVAMGQSYTIGSRSLTRANLSEIRSSIEYWNKKVTELENASKNKGRNKQYRFVPRDF